MSSERTPNLKMHVWAPPDYVKNTEFNENFMKIDDELVKRPKTVNGIAPDASGDVKIPVPEIDTSKLATKPEVEKISSQLAETARRLKTNTMP